MKNALAKHAEIKFLKHRTEEKATNLLQKEFHAASNYHVQILISCIARKEKQILLLFVTN